MVQFMLSVIRPSVVLMSVVAPNVHMLILSLIGLFLVYHVLWSDWLIVMKVLAAEYQNYFDIN